MIRDKDHPVQGRTREGFHRMIIELAVSIYDKALLKAAAMNSKDTYHHWLFSRVLKIEWGEGITAAPLMYLEQPKYTAIKIIDKNLKLKFMISLKERKKRKRPNSKITAKTADDVVLV